MSPEGGQGRRLQGSEDGGGRSRIRGGSKRPQGRGMGLTKEGFQLDVGLSMSSSIS